MRGSACVIRELRPEQLSVAEAGQLDRIFFEAGGRAFPSEEQRVAFRHRWLGRYLQGCTDVLLVAQDAAGDLIGYLVGSLKDPAEQERFADITYFRGEFRDLCRSYPAHLHINLAAAVRSRGIGARLIGTFAERARAAGAAGMHVVTGSQARNVGFYIRCGFAPLRVAAWNGRQVLFLGRLLAPST